MKKQPPFLGNNTLRRNVLAACAMATFIAVTTTACSVKSIASKEASLPTLSPIAPIPSAIIHDTLGMDFGSYKTILSAEDYVALSRFFPVLQEDAPFLVGYAPSADEGWVAQETTLDCFRKETESMSMYAEPPEICSFALCDMDQDGEQELILAFDNAAETFLILHQSGGKFQGVIKYKRGFQMLQTNGIYNSAGGVGFNEHQRMTFKDDAVQIEILAREEAVSGEEKYWIGGKEETYSKYNNWVDDNSPGEVTWYK